MNGPAPPRRAAFVLAILAVAPPAAAAPALVCLAEGFAAEIPTAPAAVEVLSTSRTSPLEGPILDLAFFGDDRLVVLGADSVALYRWDDTGLTLQARSPLPGHLDTVRFPGGLLRVAERDAAFWVLTSRSPRALLFAVEEGRLVERQEAEALPWPGSPAGLRYRPGTNLVEGAVGDLGAGPFLALDDFAPGVAVTADGVLRQGEAAGPTVGPALAALWPGVVAAPSAEPPGEDDAILIVATPGGAADGPRVLDALAVDGAVRALAGRPRGGSMRLVAALEDEQGGARLLVMDLRHLQP